PKKGKSYRAKINGTRQEIPLPAVQETGVKVKLVSQDDDIVRMMVHGKGQNRDIPYYLTTLNRGRGLFFTEVSWDKLNTLLEFGAQELGEGVNRFVLLNKNLRPISERLVFNQNAAVAHLQVEVSEDDFSTRNEVEMNIAVNEYYLNQWAKVSVAVVDENYVNSKGISQNIASYLLLDSELKGHIESPASYFTSGEGLSAQNKLDLLMCTNGWSNYVWNFLKPENISLDLEPELGFTFEGNVKRGISKKALKEGSVSLIVKTDSTTQFVDQDIDEFGKFEFRNIIFYDTASVFAQARNKRDNHSVKLEMQKKKFVKPEISPSLLGQVSSFSDIPLSVYRQRYLNEIRLREFNIDKNNILLGEIEVAASKPKPKFKTGMPLKNQGAYLLSEQQTAGYSNILEYIAYGIPGTKPIYSEKGILIAVSIAPGLDGGPVGFFIDGFLYYSGEDVKIFNISDFKSIEIIMPPASNFYGARAINGAVVLSFKSGDERAMERPLLGGIIDKYKGFTKLREFYSPLYTPEDVYAETPDYRNTLYWNPDVSLSGFENRIS
ncbi:MAG: Plug domain-containing protein, partial [Draconibacterium sp.]|nr:Plug domain-containing protein [Draconibacterium sp.]